MKMQAYLKTVLLLGCVLLAGCSVKVDPMKNWQVTQVNPNTIHASPSDMTMLVSIPTSAPGFASSLMPYMQNPHQITYYTQNRWVGAPGSMLAPLIVQSMQNTGRFKAVIAAPYAGFSDVRLDVVVLEFYQDFTQKPSREKVKLQVQLVNLHNHRVIATQTIAVQAMAPTDDYEGGVAAANQAVSQALAQLAQFVVNNTKGMKASKASVPAQLKTLNNERQDEAGRSEAA